MKSIFKTTILLILISSLNATGQNEIKLSELPYNISFYGDNVIHPGLKIGTSYIFKTKDKTKIRKFKGLENKWGSKLKTIDFSADLNLGFYNHPNNHLGTFLGIGVTRLRTKARKNRVLGFSFEINYLRKFYNLPTYILNENNEVERKRFSGTNEVMFVFAPTFGKNILTKKEFGGVRIFAKPSIQLISYNHSFLPNFALELGCTLNINK